MLPSLTDGAAAVERGRALASGPTIAFALALAAGIGWRWHLAKFVPHPRDIVALQQWAVGEARWPSHITPYLHCDYPPLYPTVLWFTEQAHAALGLPGDFSEPLKYRSLEASRPVTVLLKLWPFLGDLAGATLLLAAGAATARAAWAAGLWLLLPATWYVSAYWGQNDTLLSALSLALILAARRLRPIAVGVLAAVMLLFKMQAIPIVIVVGAAIIGRRHLWKNRAGQALAGVVVALAAVGVGAGIAGHERQFSAGYRGVGQYPKTTINGMNVWWLATRPWDRPVQQRDFPRDDIPLAFGVTARTIGLAAFGACLALIIALLRRADWSPTAVAAGCGVAMFSFAMVCTEMHERYALAALGPLLLAGVARRRYLVLAAAASVPIWLNCIAGAPWDGGIPASWQAALNRMADPEYGALRTSVAIANVACWLAAIILLARERREEASPAAAAISSPRN